MHEGKWFRRVAVCAGRHFFLRTNFEVSWLCSPLVEYWSNFWQLLTLAPRQVFGRAKDQAATQQVLSNILSAV